MSLQPHQHILRRLYEGKRFRIHYEQKSQSGSVITTHFDTNSNSLPSARAEANDWARVKNNPDSLTGQVKILRVEPLSEDYSTNPSYEVGNNQRPGISKPTAELTKKEGEEFHTTGEERREVRLADRILKAAKLLAATPDVEEIIRCAEELKRTHGVTE